MKVLVIEDSADVAEAVSLCLQIRWPEATLSLAADGTKGIEVLQSDSFDIVILDLNLPDIDGFDVLNRIRSFSNVPVIIITVRGKEEDQAKGLEIGADDYIVKPFRPRDLVARVNAVLRRANSMEVTGEESHLVRGELKLNLATNEVCLRDRILKLTPTECRLLYVLMKNANRTLNAREVSQFVWDEEYSDRERLRTYVRRLRNKIGDKPPRIILTEHGKGYRLVNTSY